MNLRGAAVLSLLVAAAGITGPEAGPVDGWLLMVPPRQTAGGNVATGEPLSKWQTSGNFATRVDCDTEMSKQQSAVLGRCGRIAIAQNSGRVATARNALQTNAAPILNGRCISASDLRLKVIDHMKLATPPESNAFGLREVGLAVVSRPSNGNSPY